MSTRAHVGERRRRRAAVDVARALGNGTLRRDELVEVCRGTSRRADLVWNGLPLDLVRVPPSGTWERRRADLYATAEAWLGPSDAARHSGLSICSARYLSGFGPARLSDAASWAGVPVTALQPASEHLRAAALPRRGRQGAARPAAGAASHRRRARPCGSCRPGTRRCSSTRGARRFLPERFRPLVFDTKTRTRSLPSLSTAPSPGRGEPSVPRGKATLLLEPFEPLPRRRAGAPRRGRTARALRRGGRDLLAVRLARPADIEPAWTSTSSQTSPALGLSDAGLERSRRARPSSRRRRADARPAGRPRLGDVRHLRGLGLGRAPLGFRSARPRRLLRRAGAARPRRRPRRPRARDRAVRCLSIPRDDFLALVETEPSFALHMLRELARRLVEARAAV